MVQLWQCVVLAPGSCATSGPGVGGRGVAFDLVVTLWLQVLVWAAFLLLPCSQQLGSVARHTPPLLCPALPLSPPRASPSAPPRMWAGAWARLLSCGSARRQARRGAVGGGERGVACAGGGGRGGRGERGGGGGRGGALRWLRRAPLQQPDVGAARVGRLLLRQLRAALRMLPPLRGRGADAADPAGLCRAVAGLAGGA